MTPLFSLIALDRALENAKKPYVYKPRPRPQPLYDAPRLDALRREREARIAKWGEEGGQDVKAKQW